MSTNAQILDNCENDNLLKELEHLPKYAADQVRNGFKNMSVDQYKNWLKMMYHYTLGSEEKGIGAAKISHTDELKSFFEHMAKEERGHYILAEKDLEALDDPIDKTEATPEPVAIYNKWWDSLYSKEEAGALSFLAALYVFENIAKYLASDVIKVLRDMNLNKKQTRWVFVHAEADDEHGDELSEIMSNYFDSNQEVIIKAAKQAADLWVNINRHPFV